jgi:general secretion pathway protein L
MSTLIVALPLETASSGTEWAFALTPDGRTLADHGNAPAALLPQPRGAGAEVVALIPVQALAWHRVDLPRGATPGTPRMRTALEGVLEEQLLDDTEAVHFALQPGARAGERTWVGVCDRAWLRNALQLLEAAGRPAARIVPEFAPEGAPALAVLGDPEQPVVVSSSDEGVICLPLSPAALPLLPALPEDAPRLAEPAVAGVAEQILQHQLTLQQAPQRWLAAARTRWDFAQFDFASSAQARTFRKIATGWGEILHAAPWRPARWAAVALLAINLAGLNAWAWKERASLDDKKAQVRRTLTDTFPQVKVVVDAPVQMEREVAALRQQTGVASARDLDAVLGALATALPPGRVPASLSYSGGELRAGGLTLSPDAFSAIAANLKTLGYGTSFEGNTIVVAAEDAR